MKQIVLITCPTDISYFVVVQDTGILKLEVAYVGSLEIGPPGYDI